MSGSIGGRAAISERSVTDTIVGTVTGTMAGRRPSYGMLRSGSGGSQPPSPAERQFRVISSQSALSQWHPRVGTRRDCSRSCSGQYQDRREPVHPAGRWPYFRHVLRPFQPVPVFRYPADHHRPGDAGDCRPRAGRGQMARHHHGHRLCLDPLLGFPDLCRVRGIPSAPARGNSPVRRRRARKRAGDLLQH